MPYSINIGTITDKNYTQHTGVMLFSILKNCSAPEKIHFYIMDGGIGEEGKKLLKEVCEPFNAKISFPKPDLRKFNGLKIGSHLTPIIYAKLLFPSVVKDAKKIIVMDSDIIVEGDIKELFDTDLRGNVLGAVPDGAEELQIYGKEILGLTKDQQYFNSGVMLVDSEKWNKFKVLEKVIDYIYKNFERIYVQDQDGLNAVLRDYWLPLDYKWNVIHLFYYNSVGLKRMIGFKRARDIAKNPKIIHFTTKPWIFEKVHPLRKRYWYYLRQTSWNNFQYPNKNMKTLILKISRFLIRPLPWEFKIFLRNKFKSNTSEKNKDYYIVDIK